VPILAPVAIDTAKKRSASGQDNAGLYLLVTTSTGVYELQVPLTGAIGDTLPVTWMVTNEMYTNQIRRRIGGNDLADDGNGNLLRPILFKPRQARYLPNGNVLIVNGYNGTTLVRDGQSVSSARLSRRGVRAERRSLHPRSGLRERFHRLEYAGSPRT
jgi:hypothetical protein